MKKSILVLLATWPVFVMAQNVGIGITTPTAKLEVNNNGRSTVKISSASFSDTTQLVLSNRDVINQGTDFLITSRGEQGLFFTSASDLPGNIRDSLFSMLPNGNIGVAVRSPSYRLQVHNPSSLTTYLNVTNSATGVGVNNGLLVGMSSATAIINNTEFGSLQFGTDNLTRVTIDNAGNVGVGNTIPAEKLDVAGNINVTGTIKANGVDGSANQVLMKNGSGNMAWGDICEYKNFVSFSTIGTNTWTVPAGVTKILVELWGAGGGGNLLAGGGGGGNIKAHFTVTPGSGIDYTLGTGGSGALTASASGGSPSSCTVNFNTLTAGGGQGALYISATNGQAGTGGSWSTSGITNYIGTQGLPGQSTKRNYSQVAAGVFYESGEAGRGGNGGNTENTGAWGQTYIYNTTGATLIFRNGNPSGGLLPGGGGSSGIQYGGSTIAGGNGSQGFIIIRY